jgi:hypothetical protein
MNSFILVPYYNSIPDSNSKFFTIIDNKLVISLTDVFGNSTKFLTTSLNKIIYILNRTNIGTFRINSILITTDKSYTLSINLQTTIPNLTNNTYCVISLITSVYSIERIFTNKINTYNNGNFTILNQGSFLINKSSVLTDDTLFLYMLITNNSFNIVDNKTSLSYAINNVVLSNEQTNSKYIELYADIPIIPLIDNSVYEINILTSKSNSNNSNNSINNYSTYITPSTNSNNINIVNNLSNIIPYNDNVLLTYQPNNFYGNGYFSLGLVNNTITDMYTNLPENLVIEKYETNDIRNILSNGFNRYNELINSVITTGTQLLQNQVSPDVISNVSIIIGTKYILSTSVIDSFKKQVNLIKQHSLLFLTSGLDKYTLFITTNPIHINDYNHRIECNIILDNVFPDNVNKTYVLSTYPVLSSVTFQYISTYTISNVIESGKFNILSISGTNMFPTIVISNYDILYNNDVSSFNNLLYTIIQDPTKSISPPYLNILNSDYSVLCTLAILQVIPDIKQTTFTYSIVSGAENLNKLNNTTNYIFTLLSTSDFISDNGILNTTKKLKNSLVNIDNLIQNSKVIINKSILTKPSNPNILIAKNIITTTSLQSTAIKNMEMTSDYAHISDSLLANTYNAVQNALLGDPQNKDLLLINTKINNQYNPLIILAVLNNISSHTKTALAKFPNNDNIIIANNYVNTFIKSINLPNNDLDIKSMMTTLSSYLNTAIKNNPTNISLIKSNRLLNQFINPTVIPEQFTISEKKVGKIIERLDNINSSNSDNSNYFLIISILLLFITYLIYKSNKMA